MDNFSLSLIADMDIVSWSTLLFGTLAVFVAAMIQGSTGLGFGMVAAPILMIINPVFVPGAPLFLAMLVSSLIAIREWSSIDWKGLSVSLGGRVAGTLLAGLTITAIPLPLFGLLFGLIVLSTVLLSAKGWKALPTTKNLLAGGFASGYMGTITSIGSPPIALVYQHQSGAVIRATLAMFFTFGAAISIAMLVSLDLFSMEQLVISMVFLPALLAGFWVSNWTATMVHGRAVKNSVLALSASTALILVIKSTSALI